MKNMNLGPTLKALYAGRYDQQDTAAILESEGYDVGDYTCECVEPRDYYYVEQFTSDVAQPPWTDGTSTTEWDNRGSGSVRMDNGLDHVDLQRTALCAELGISTRDLLVHRLKFKWMESVPGNSVPRFRVTFDDGQIVWDMPGGGNAWEFYEKEYIFDPPKLWDTGFPFEFDRAAFNNYLYLGQFELDLDDV
jgi:hypothetical protein